MSQRKIQTCAEFPWANLARTAICPYWGLNKHWGALQQLKRSIKWKSIKANRVPTSSSFHLPPGCARSAKWARSVCNEPQKETAPAEGPAEAVRGVVPLAKGTDGTARPFPMAHFDAATRGRTPASGTLNLGFRGRGDLRGLGD
jgi:hypothetical protein